MMPERAAAERPAILIVDDDEDLLGLLEVRLGKKYDVILARDGEEALAKISETPPDLVILDVMMPRLGGWSVCWTLKNHATYRSIPIIFLTAVGNSPQVSGQLARADDYLLKPFEMETLDEKVDHFLSVG